MIKNFGRRESGKDNFEVFGINLKFTDLQAVIGIEQMKKLTYRTKKMRKLTCHCEGVEIQVKIPEEGFKKIMRCNCSLCKRKGYIIGVIGPDDLKVIKGEKLLKLYQYHTKTAKHYFCSNCGIHTHNNPRSNPKIYGINVACVEGINPFELKNVSINDGENHPLDKK